ncbi:MAG: hypothetical protein SF029_11900 [bacterium]|nr:hypothetical protein [bacterium]
MLSEAFVEQLHQLSDVEKLRVVQLLVNDLAGGENLPFVTDTESHLLTPAGAEEATTSLFEVIVASATPRVSLLEAVANLSDELQIESQRDDISENFDEVLRQIVQKRIASRKDRTGDE